MACMLHKRKRCSIIPPGWLDKETLTELLDEEKSTTQKFQDLPFYYVEIAKLLFQNAVEAFGDDYLESTSLPFQSSNNTDNGPAACGGQVTGLIESIRKVRYNKIETGLRKVSEAITVKLNNLSAAECNMIRLLFKGTLDHFHQISKVGSVLPHDLAQLYAHRKGRCHRLSRRWPGHTQLLLHACQSVTGWVDSDRLATKANDRKWTEQNLASANSSIPFTGTEFSGSGF
eukprot:364927-Chlamydomonas_euryale.AAC.16